MSRETESLAPPRFWEKGLFLLFLAGAVFCGHSLFEQVSHVTPILRQIDSKPGRMGSEWSEVVLFDGVHVPIQDWATKQASLDRRLAQFSTHTLDLGLVYSVFPPSLLELRSFEDFTIRPATPLPGTVFQLGLEPRCIEFSWSEVPIQGVSYVLEMAKTRDFRFYRSFGAKTNHLNIQIGTGSDYFWRIQGIQNNKKRQIGGVSSLLAIDPPLTDDEKYLRDTARRVRLADAWFADVSYCRGRTPASSQK